MAEKKEQVRVNIELPRNEFDAVHKLTVERQITLREYFRTLVKRSIERVQDDDVKKIYANH